jgi:hypothetical protein
MSAVIRSLEKRFDRISGETLEVNVPRESAHFEDIKSFLSEGQSHISLIRDLGI